MNIDHEAIVQVFLAQSEEGLFAMEEGLVALESRPEDAETLGEIFRVVHTLKGDAASLGFAALADFSHKLEDLLDDLRSGRAQATGDRVTLLLQAVDVLRELLSKAAEGIDEAQPAHQELLRRLRAGTADRRHPRKRGKSRRDALRAQGRQAPEGADDEVQARASRSRTLRVDIDKLDQLLTLTGEIAIARGRLTEMLESGVGLSTVEIVETHREADQLYLDLQEQVMKVRMLAVGPTFRQHIRTVRDLARAHGKQARLVIEGEDVEVDTAVVEHIRDPLVHMIRNALDHGIEPPEVRKASGKDPCGSVTLKAYHEAGNIVIELGDDGAGLNRERILEKALSRGVIADPGTLSDEEVHRLVFEAGLSTAQTVTELSGRGVGMDVVRRNIDALRGSVGIESREGRGTTITLRFPLTLAIIEVFSVGVDGETYLIPLDAIVECLELPEEGQSGANGGGVINLRGRTLPYLRLREVLALGANTPQREKLVVVQHSGRQAGLAVDALYGERQTVIKPLGKLFQGLAGVGGCAILGNGRIALILDVPGLLQQALKQESALVEV